MVLTGFYTQKPYNTCSTPMAKPLPPSEIQLATQDALQQLGQFQSYGQITVEGSVIELTHLAKPMWSASPEHPEQVNVSKRDMLHYYLTVAPQLLAYLKDRPLTVKRCPEGINGPSFMQRHIDNLPEFVQTVEICVDNQGNNQPFLLCQNLASLVWLVNQDVVEFHPWHSRINPEETKLPTIFINSMGTLDMSVLNYPDWLVMDIDPGEGSDFDKTRAATLLIHQHLLGQSLNHLVKLSGKRGIHILLPLQRKYTFDQVRLAARRLSEQLADRFDDDFTTEWNVEQRHGKIFLDYQQNARGKSQVAAYSLRTTDQATISAPISWEALDLTSPTDLTLSQAFQTSPKGDGFIAELYAQAQELPENLLQ